MAATKRRKPKTVPKRAPDVKDPILEACREWGAEDAIDFEDPVLDFDAIKATEEVGDPNKTVLKPGDATGIGNRQRIVRRGKRYNIDTIPAAVDMIRPLPKPGTSLHCIMGGDFHGFDLIPAIVELAGPIEVLTLTTLGFNALNNQHLVEMIDKGTVGTATILCSTYFQRTTPDLYATSADNLRKRGSRIRYTRNHAKVFLAKTRKGAHYVVEGSANLRSCTNIEQIAIFHDKGLYQFHLNWIETVFNESAT